jgi:hypothetical protein
MNQTPSDELPEKLLTRREAASFLSDTIGRPTAYSSLMKMASLKTGPPVAEKWGRRVLYRRADLVAWAMSRARPVTPPAAAR